MPDETSDVCPSPEIIAAAEAVLTASLGGRVRLGDAKQFPGSKRSSVYRVAVLGALDTPGASDIPSTVVIKRVNSGAQDAGDSAATLVRWTFHNDWASLRFLSELTDELGIAPLAPRLYGGDPSVGLVVMQDLGSGSRLDHELLGADPETAEAALVEYAVIHARLHGLSAGRHARYAAIRDALGPAENPTGHDRFDWLDATLDEITTALGITPVPGASAELAALRKALREPGPFFTFTQGDACPDNCIRVGGTLRLLDFEGGRFAHALGEGVYGRMRFPTCWCVAQMPERVAQRVEDAYRAELARWLPEAADDSRFYAAVVQACVVWMLDWLRAFPLRGQLEGDQTWRMASVRQRTMSRLEIAVRVTEEYHHLATLGATLGATLQAVRQRLEARWPAEAQQMPLYPAFG